MVTFTLIILSASVVLAGILGRWSLVAVTIGIVGAIAVYLVLNNGWYGAGWGEFGVALNVFAGALAIAVANLGVALRKVMRRRREQTVLLHPINTSHARS